MSGHSGVSSPAIRSRAPNVGNRAFGGFAAARAVSAPAPLEKSLAWRIRRFDFGTAGRRTNRPT
jgi:hypothetical protein